MPTATILYITLAALFALGFVYFTYFFKSKTIGSRIYFLGFLRFISIFTLLVLLINPEINQTEFEVEKPELILAIDESASINNLEKSDSVNLLAAALIKDERLKEQFSITEYVFANKIKKKEREKLDFNKKSTNIHNALNQIKKLHKAKPNALVLITDGNATFGQEYEYTTVNKNSTILPVVVGDTAATLDFAISALNVNKYAFLNNKFPVEIILNYSGKEAIKAKFQLKSGQNILANKTVDFNSEKTSEVINITLSASQIGTLIYEAIISTSEKEKNTFNNQRKFAIEVIDEKTRVLLVSNISHPDIGAFKKAIEMNEQREVILKNISNFKLSELNDFQLVIIYQPNSKFNNLFSEISKQKINNFIVTGTQTDWNFMNNSQSYFSKLPSNQTQEIFPVYNENFLQFQFEDIDFNRFPPLEDKFGTVKITSENEATLLYQKIEGINTNSPLMAIFQDGNIKTGVLFGENLWKWRTETFRNSQTFEDFDNFIGKFIQYLSSNKKRDRLTFEAEPIYFENDKILISAQFFDENYVFSPNGNLNLYIENMVSKERFEAQMLPNTNFYELELENLEPGDYQFTIKEETSGIQRKGAFSVLEFNVEQQYASANFKKLNFLARNNSGNLYFLNQIQQIIEDLLTNKRFVPVQKSREKTVPLINWKFLLILLVLSLSSEWFTRKYFGLI